MTNKTKKILRIAIFSVIALILTAIIGCVIYLAVPFKQEDIVFKLLESSEITSEENNVTTIDTGNDSTTGIIFYPGAKVEANAYLPLFENVAKQTNAICYLVDMPFNLAFLDVNAAQDIIDANPEIEKWYMAGHSLGGGMASDFASDNEEIIDGVIVLGSYVYGDFPTENSLTVYGTFNSNIENGIDYTDNIVIIEGGNHAQFGNYGKQPGDPDATITAQEQQDITADAIKEFLTAQGAI